jgi:hypothetical protein
MMIKGLALSEESVQKDRKKEQYRMRPSDRTRLAVHLLLMVIPPAMVLVALALGQDASWDVRNYHFYNPFAYLTGRMGHDIAMGQVATYYNPLLHLPFYKAVVYLPPRAVGFVLGLLPGLNIFLLYGLARRTIGSAMPVRAEWLCLAAAALGLLGAAGISEIGTSFGDSVVSLLVLASLWLLVRLRAHLATPGFAGLGVAAAAGLLAGAAFGLKQPFAIYAVGLCAAFFGLALPWRRRFRLAFVFGLGVLAGAALTGGFWMLEMWQRFQNPLFPYFNQIFHSPWGAEAPYRDERFLPKGLGMQLLFPIWFVFKPLQVAEVPFRDLRFAVLYLVLIVALIFWLARRLGVLVRKPAAARGAEREALSEPPMLGFMIIFMGVTFVVWMKLFAVYRYLMVCEMLAPLVLLLLLDFLTNDSRRRLMLVLGCFALILVSVRPAVWERRPWGPSYFGVQAPAIDAPADTLVLAAGLEPVAYMIPFFPPRVRFLRIQSYFTGPSAQPNATDRMMQGIVAGHQGPLFILYRSFEEAAARAALAFYGLTLGEQDCQTFIPGIEPDQNYPFHFCPLIKEERR